MMINMGIKNESSLMTKRMMAWLALATFFCSMDLFAAQGFVLNTGDNTPNGAIVFAGDGTVREGTEKRDCLIGYRLSLDQASHQNQFTRFLKLIAGREYLCTLEKKPDEVLIIAHIEDQTMLVIRFESNNNCTWQYRLSERSTLEEKVSQFASCGEFGKVEY